LKKQLKYSRINKNLNLFFGKAPPFIVDIALISYPIFFEVGNIHWPLLTITELYRAAWTFRIYRIGKYNERENKLLILYFRKKDLIDKVIKTTDNLLDSLEKNNDKGEKWKKGTDY
jgi:hypothetical protein